LSSLLLKPVGASPPFDPLLAFVSSALFKSLAPSTNVNAWRGDEDAQGPSYLGTDDFIAIALDTQFGKPVTSYTQLKLWQIEQERLGAKLAEVLSLLQRSSLAFIREAGAAAMDSDPQADALRLAAFRRLLGRWYVAAGDRSQGGYKRWSQAWLLGIGFAVAFLANLDALAVARYLYSHPEAAARLADRAENWLRNENSKAGANSTANSAPTPPPGAKPEPITTAQPSQAPQATLPANAVTATKPAKAPPAPGRPEAEITSQPAKATPAPGRPEAEITSQRAKATPAPRRTEAETTSQPVDPRRESARAMLEELSDMGLQIGWSQVRGKRSLNKGECWLSSIERFLGWLLTVLAVTLGAPFWFDLLNKLVSLRSSGARPQDRKDPTEGTGPGSAGAPVGGQGPQGAAGLQGPSSAARGNQPPFTRRVYFLDQKRKDDLKGFDEAIAELIVKPAPPPWPTNLRDPANRPHFAHLALLGARASWLVYEDRPFIEHVLAGWGFKLEKDAFFNRGGTQAFLAYRGETLETTTDVLMAFRGTEPDRAEDLLTDARVSKKSLLTPAGAPPRGAVHSGFDLALDAVWPEIEAQLNPLLQVGPRRLWITGHSLGGALATLALERVLQLPHAELKSRTALMSYGCPRVGDKDFIENLHRLISPLRMLRLIHGEDLVTRVPPRSMGYDHVGTPSTLTAGGELRHGSDEWNRFLSTVLFALEDFKLAAKSGVAHHDMAFYIAKLEAIAEG
jgi:triacylglycerol lipase